MTDSDSRRPTPRLAVDGLAALHAATSRRAFFRVVALGGTLALLPAFVNACGEDSPTAPGNGAPGSGEPLLIDFAQGDVAILQFAYVLEQIQADFYGRVVSAFGTSNITASEQTILGEIRNHEIAHRDLLKAALGADATSVATATFRGTSFSDRTSVLAAAKSLEDLAVAAYNGVAQYLSAPDRLLTIAKIVSVEARHSSTIRDLANPRSIDFAPKSTDDVFRPAKVAVTLQTNLVDKLAFANAPATFVQGPGNNG